MQLLSCKTQLFSCVTIKINRNYLRDTSAIVATRALVACNAPELHGNANMQKLEMQMRLDNVDVVDDVF